MVLSIRRWMSRIVFLVIFAILLLIVTGGYRWLAEALSPVQPYRVPAGDALKVFKSEPGPPDSSNAADRLRWFFYYGE
ncbi:DUF4227 family protein [Paenibacillus arenilitoris]|uniref:DUF4227 family protein n=1 Tax=Paenibacillus arenilitoris TaxID=2772299 RepID=A0A927CMJ9_9BACL|nr:DUF4227 family protein [Paenibacillus arenilitoris]MBD2869587.1 DUF4227 family protein [Paenibacillus arenilitoris]